MRIRDADDLITHKVAATLDALDLDAADQAAAALARRYAQAIDDDHNGKELDELGPKLLAVLESLGATPAARARITKGGATTSANTRLGALRAARAN